MSRVLRASELAAADLSSPSAQHEHSLRPWSIAQPRITLVRAYSTRPKTALFLVDSPEAILIAAAHRVCDDVAISAPDTTTRKRRRHLVSSIFTTPAPSTSSAPAIWAPRPLAKVTAQAWSRVCFGFGPMPGSHAVASLSEAASSSVASADAARTLGEDGAGVAAGGASAALRGGGARPRLSLPQSTTAGSWLVPVFVDVRLSNTEFRLVGED